MRPGLKRTIRAAVLAVIFAFSLQMQTMVPVALAVTQAEIDALKDNASAISNEMSELEAQLQKLENDKTSALQQIENLDRQNETLRQEIAVQERLIQEYEGLIVQTEQELLDAQQREAEQYELFCNRVRAMEENGTVTYWSVLFKSTDINDLLSRLSDVGEVMAADRRVIEELEAIRLEIEEKKATLETSLAEAQEVRSRQSESQAKLQSQIAKAQELARQIEAGIGEYADALAQMEAEEARVKAEIARKEAELAASLPSPTTGGYIWPVDSRRITSPFGYRGDIGVAGATSYHDAIDIGGVYYSSKVYAAKAGTVTISKYSSSFGNYVVVSHGSGNSTLYAHMSSRNVSVGDWVNQGDVLGITGSTGISSGPHLHFEIIENGINVDPLKYLGGYILV